MYPVEMVPGSLISLPGLVMIGSVVQKLLDGRYTDADGNAMS
jgi:hypothetical protein